MARTTNDAAILHSIVVYPLRRAVICNLGGRGWVVHELEGENWGMGRRWCRTTTTINAAISHGVVIYPMGRDGICDLGGCGWVVHELEGGEKWGMGCGWRWTTTTMNDAAISRGVVVYVTRGGGESNLAGRGWITS
jgi:hypothetical protein